MEDFFIEDKRAEWNTKLFDYFKIEEDATIEDYFGIWARFVGEYGQPSMPDEPLIFQDHPHPFGFRKITRRGAIYHPLMMMYEDVPLYHRIVTSTILPIEVQYSIAEALGAALVKEEGNWMAPQVDQKFWEDCFVLLILEYEMYIVAKVLTDLDSKRAILILNTIDEVYFML